MVQCSIDKCDNKEMASNMWDGQKYCEVHYDQLIHEELTSKYIEWKKGESVPESFKKILGRAYDEEYFDDSGDSYLSAARIRDRGFNYVKTEKGCSFEITRHLNAWEGRGKRENKVEQWDVDISNKTFALIGRRKFQKGEYGG